MEVSLTVFDQMVYQFETIATGAIPTVRSLVMATFWMLATIDACMAFLMNLEDGNHFKILISKCLKIGFWLFMLTNWGTFCNVIRDSLVMVGTAVGGGGDISIMKHPSSIVGMGFTTTDPIIQFIKTFEGAMDILSNLPIILACIVAYLFTCVAYCIVGIQVVLTYVEFYLAAAMFVVFVPMGVTKWTSFLAEKAIGGIIAYGVKLMVAACVLGNIKTIIEPYTYTAITADNALTYLVSLVAVSMLMAFLAWQVPALAASVMTGGPSLTAGSAVQTAAGAAVAAAGMGAIASGVASKAGGSGEKNSSSSSKGSTSDAAGAVNQDGAGSSSGSECSSSSSGSDGGSGSSSPTFSGGGQASYAGASGGGSGSSGNSGGAYGGSNSFGGSSSQGGSGNRGGSSAAGGAASGSASGGSGSAGRRGGATGAAAGGGSSYSGSQSGYDGGTGGSAGGGDASGADSSTYGGSASSGSTSSDGSLGSPGAAGASGNSVAGNSGQPGGQNSSKNGNASNVQGQQKDNTFATKMAKVVNGANIARSVIPQEASPKGGISAPVPRD